MTYRNSTSWVLKLEDPASASSIEKLLLSKDKEKLATNKILGQNAPKSYTAFLVKQHTCLEQKRTKTMQ